MTSLIHIIGGINQKMLYSIWMLFDWNYVWPTEIAKFMGPTWRPPGSGPMLAPCYQGMLHRYWLMLPYLGQCYRIISFMLKVIHVGVHVNTYGLVLPEPIAVFKMYDGFYVFWITFLSSTNSSWLGLFFSNNMYINGNIIHTSSYKTAGIRSTRTLPRFGSKGSPCPKIACIDCTKSHGLYMECM